MFEKGNILFLPRGVKVIDIEKQPPFTTQVQSLQPRCRGLDQDTTLHSYCNLIVSKETDPLVHFTVQDLFWYLDAQPCFALSFQNPALLTFS